MGVCQAEPDTALSCLRELTDTRRSGVKDVQQMIADLNPVLRGWGDYFRTGNADGKFNQIDNYVHARLVRWLYRRGGPREQRQLREGTHQSFYAMGWHRLRGTVC